MLMQRKRMVRQEKGFTLIELMIVVAIIGILAAIAVPNFVTYRNKSRVSAGVGTGESIRAALASFAADQADNLFPTTTDISTHATLTALANKNGASLKDSGFSYVAYSVLDTDGDKTDDSYALWVTVTGVPTTGYPGAWLRIAPDGITRCPSGTTAASC